MCCLCRLFSSVVNLNLLFRVYLFLYVIISFPDDPVVTFVLLPGGVLVRRMYSKKLGRDGRELLGTSPPTLFSFSTIISFFDFNLYGPPHCMHPGFVGG